MVKLLQLPGLPTLQQGKFIAAFLAIALLINWRLVWGWFYYYTQYYHAFRGNAASVRNCVNILNEPNLWMRIREDKYWWFRMRCEGQLDGSLRREWFSRIGSYVLKWYWVQTAIAIFHWSLPEVEIPEVNGFSLLLTTGGEVLDFLYPAVLLPTFYAWWLVSRVVILPLKILYAIAYIVGRTTTFFHTKLNLPAIPIPDMSNFPFVPALPREYLRQLPSLSRERLPSVSIPPLMGWPIISHISNITSSIAGFSDRPYDPASRNIHIAYFITEFLFHAGLNFFLWLIKHRTDISLIVTIGSVIISEIIMGIAYLWAIPYSNYSFTTVVLHIISFISEYLFWAAGSFFFNIARKAAFLNGTPEAHADDDNEADTEEATSIPSSLLITGGEVGEGQTSGSIIDLGKF